ncbi:putative transcriptional regulator, GntR family [Actinobacteria bacterium OK074]|nr:putative transcriptional regulator, GntR family [Actinobacteria bacterium OK074]
MTPAAKGCRGTQRIVHAGEVPAPDEVAVLLGVAAGGTVVVRRRVIELDGEPCELTDAYYPLASFMANPFLLDRTR